ncbi:hypothetical protein MTO96_032227 [Rhipicephalus appendiculatus]
MKILLGSPLFPAAMSDQATLSGPFGIPPGNFCKKKQTCGPPPDYVLLMFLRARKYRVNDALKSLKNFFRIRRSLPEYYDNFLPSALDYQTITREHKLVRLSNDRDSQGRAVGLIRFGAWNSSVCPFNEFIRSIFMGVECAVLEEETQIRGIVGVNDFAGLGMHHIVQMTPRFLRMIIALAQETYPMRPKAFYIVNTPAVFEGIFNMFVRPFLSKKLKQRVHLLKGGLSELRDIIPSDLIPKEYGGTFEDFDLDRLERYILGKESHFEVISQCGYETNRSTNSTVKNETQAPHFVGLLSDVPLE